MAEPTFRDIEFERLYDLLAAQIERENYADARETVEALLRLRPADKDLLDARVFVNEQLPPETDPPGGVDDGGTSTP